MIKVLYSNAYGDKIPNDVPVREMDRSTCEQLKSVATEAFKDSF